MLIIRSFIAKASPLIDNHRIVGADTFDEGVNIHGTNYDHMRRTIYIKTETYKGRRISPNLNKKAFTMGQV